MSKIFRRPKSYLKMGNTHARLIKAAREIKSHEQLAALVAQALHSGVEKAQVVGWLEMTLPHLPFKAKLSEPSETVLG